VVDRAAGSEHQADPGHLARCRLSNPPGLAHDGRCDACEERGEDRRRIPANALLFRAEGLGLEIDDGDFGRAVDVLTGIEPGDAERPESVMEGPL
jgi:hypothetical protein